MRNLLLSIAVLTAGCAGHQLQPAFSVGEIPGQIRQSLSVSGDIRVRGEVRVFPGAVLTVLPGTRLLFEPFDPDGDGVNDSRLVVEGILVARGDPDRPISFTSGSSDPQPGDWLEIRVDRSEGTVLEYCILEYSRYGLHAHFSSGVLVNSVLRNNIDATRFGNSRFLLTGNRVEGNVGKGVNFRDSVLVISGNEFFGNRHGIFTFERGEGTRILDNLFSRNEVSDLRAGDFYTGSPPVLRGNRRADGSRIAVSGMDWSGEDVPEAPGPGRNSGPSARRVVSEPLWQTEAGSFIDAAPVALTGPPGRELIAVATWGGGVLILDPADGSIVQRISVPDVTDATPVPIGRRLYFPSWDRKVRAADAATGEVEGLASWEESPVDDHRQAPPLVVDGTLILGLWNGDVRALDPGTMEWLWRVPLDGAVRSRPAYDGRDVWAGTDGGGLYRISPAGALRGRIALPGMVRSSPAVLSEGNLAVVTWDGTLVTLAEGKVSWQRKLPGTGTYASPLLTREGTVIAADGAGWVSHYDPGGAPLWKVWLASSVHVLTDGGWVVWAGTESGELFGLSPLSGRILTRMRAAGAVHGGPLNIGGVVGGIVWAGRDGVVRAHRIRAMEERWETAP